MSLMPYPRIDYSVSVADYLRFLATSRQVSVTSLFSLIYEGLNKQTHRRRLLD